MEDVENEYIRKIYTNETEKLFHDINSEKERFSQEFREPGKVTLVLTPPLGGGQMITLGTVSRGILREQAGFLVITFDNIPPL